MYYLILIITFTAGGSALQVEHIPFDDKASCQEALIEVLNEYDGGPAGVMTKMHIDGWCVAKGEE